MHDFLIKELGRAVPYGVYDLAANAGWVSVGIDHDTAAFAVHSIRRWWQEVGRARYPDATRLLITADGGGSNGSRVRLWKRELQTLANETGLDIVVHHLPPGTSKWNKIEHRLFSYISQNWRGRPLVSHRAREHGKSKYGFERYVRGAIDLLTVLTITKYGRRPAHLFGGLGLASSFIGFLTLAYLTVVKLFGGEAIGDRPLLMLGILLIILGVQLISIGLIAEIVLHRTANRREATDLIRERTPAEPTAQDVAMVAKKAKTEKVEA